MQNGYENLLIAAFEDGSFEQIEKSEFLDNREKQIVIGYYRDQKKLQQMGEEIGISRERVRQIKNKAMEGVRSTLYINSMSAEKQEEYRIPVEKFDDLSVRSRNALMRNHLRTAETIVKYIRSQKDVEPEEALMQMRNIGKRSAKEIYDFLRAKNLNMPV